MSSLDNQARTEASVFELLADNAAGEISARKIRDAFLTSFRKAYTTSVAQYGAIGDGVGHKVSEWLMGGRLDRGYADLGAIRKDYPHVDSLFDDANFAAFQSALTALKVAGGGTLFVPAGTYAFSQSSSDGSYNQGRRSYGKRPYLQDAINIAIIGEGPSSILKKEDDGAASPFHSVDGYLLAFYRCKHILISNVTFHGRANDSTTIIGQVGHPHINVAGHLTHKSEGQGWDHGVTFESCQNLVVTNCRFLRFFGSGMALRTQLSGTGFNQPGAPNDAWDSIGAKNQTDYRGHTTLVSGNIFFRVENLTTTTGGTDLLIITNNIFNELILGGIKLNTSLKNTGRCIISHNIFNGGRDDIIVAHSISNLAILDNQFYHCRGRDINDPRAFNHGVYTEWMSKVIAVTTSNEPVSIFYNVPYPRRNVRIERNTFVRCGVPLYVTNYHYPARKDYLITSTDNLSIVPEQGQIRASAGAFLLNGGLAGSHNNPTRGLATGNPYIKIPVPSRINLYCWGDEAARTFTVKGYQKGSTALITETLPGARGNSKEPATLTTRGIFEYVTEISVDGATRGSVSSSPEVAPLFQHHNVLIQDNCDLEPYPDGSYSRMQIGGFFSSVIVRRNYFDRRVDLARAIELKPQALSALSDPRAKNRYDPELYEISDNIDLNCVFAPEAEDLDGIALSQKPLGNGAQTLAINGALYHPAVEAALLPVQPACPVAITAAADERERIFTIVGLDFEGFPQSESLKGPNAQTVTTEKLYSAVKAILVDRPTANTVQAGVAKVDHRSAMVAFEYSYVADQSRADPTATSSADRQIGRLVLRNNTCYSTHDRFGNQPFYVPTAQFGSGSGRMFAVVNTDIPVSP